ncbi:hypothetical protein GJ744_002617 [Endocarpon pusillum]|uniref:Enoyl reductase (ER) domain-containing protein n=1 Tax=Endocarpon pusillum TaxID=364733 RepID=A0A8H7A7X1_9EURO|nr:hypothetical protein GJ744_002617 [Endocarpon pusillum]
MIHNRAAWLPEVRGQLEVRDGPEPEVGEFDVLIENKAVAINPVDWKIRDYNILGKKYPIIIGEDVSGNVVEVGSSVTKVKKGDRVLAYCVGLGTNKPINAGYQNYSVVPEITCSPFPDSLSYEQAAVVPLGASTASAALYQKDCLNLPYPKPGSREPTGTSILVWGGSGSVGASAVQLAAASGVHVVATCSKTNVDFVKGLGAKHVVDYNDESAVDQIVEALQGTKFTGVFDSVGLENTWKACGAVAEKIGGGLIIGTVPPPENVELGKGVKAKSIFAFTIVRQQPEVGNAIFRDYLPAALKSGEYKAKPDPKVVGHGLESIADGFAAQKKGVSAAKVVVTL